MWGPKQQISFIALPLTKAKDKSPTQKISLHPLSQLSILKRFLLSTLHILLAPCSRSNFTLVQVKPRGVP